MNDVTVTITSCGRFDLLQQTLDSFLKLNSYNISNILISEDSEDVDVKNNIEKRYGSLVKVFFNKKNLGLLKSLDNLFNNVTTKYIFHIEDDWLFNGTNNNFIFDSKCILDCRNDIHQVWIRNDIPEIWLNKENLIKINNVKFCLVKQYHLDEWSGFSFNPGLRRLQDYKNMFPNGFSYHQIDNLSMVHSEYACNKQTNLFNYKAAQLLDGVCCHIGNGRTTL